MVRCGELSQNWINPIGREPLSYLNETSLFARARQAGAGVMLIFFPHGNSLVICRDVPPRLLIFFRASTFHLLRRCVGHINRSHTEVRLQTNSRVFMSTCLFDQPLARLGGGHARRSYFYALRARDCHLPVVRSRYFLCCCGNH